ncbi:hypothetical protein [Sphingomonas solaris]|uniref:Uncharacterized protein n=1 Tax=Alterirhizorhabdus solaris TaxID=2529389 RepID=A0A558QUD2_9SPHN|nr:hypothetical protein [Sphingomonas solaris]TVV70744.1 hypothetical protein FOY91_18345 [Sphingomonas solaris]
MAEADPFARAYALDPDPVPADPALAAPMLRRRIAAGHADAGVWQGYGDALHALGFVARAEGAWSHARMVRGIPPRPVATPVPVRVRRGVRFHLSAGRQPPDEQDRAGMAGSIGTSDYSYGFAMRNFHAAITRVGLPCTLVHYPEYIADIRDRSDAACDIHLGFYPPEQLRLLKGAYNVACFAWEFDRLRTPAEQPGPHAFADQATMLSRADELWLPSRHGAAAVARSVSVPVRTVPAPSPTRPTPRHAPPRPMRRGWTRWRRGWRRSTGIPSPCCRTTRRPSIASPGSSDDRCRRSSPGGVAGGRRCSSRC